MFRKYKECVERLYGADRFQNFKREIVKESEIINEMMKNGNKFNCRH